MGIEVGSEKDEVEGNMGMGTNNTNFFIEINVRRVTNSC